MKKIYYLAALFLAALNLRPIITSVASMMSMIQSELGVNALTARFWFRENAVFLDSSDHDCHCTAWY